MGTFLETDAAALYNSVINKLQDDIGETLNPGDERRIFGEAMVALFVVAFNTVDDVAKQSLLKYARGAVLDAIGEGYDCPRLEAKKATTTLRFTLKSAYASDIIIPAGDRAGTEDGHNFVTDEEIIIEQGSLSADVLASAVNGGLSYNGYLAGAVNIMVDLLSYVDSVQNITTTDNGTDEELDDSYRERIRLAMSKFSTAGPANAYKYWALSADSRIADAHVTCTGACEILITIIMSDGNLLDSDILSEVLATVTADDVKPLGDHVTVSAPAAVNYDIQLTYYVKSKNEAATVDAVENDKFTDSNGKTHVGALQAYRLWQDTVIERNINPDKLRELLMNPAGDNSVPGADRVVITYPEYTELTGDVVAHFSGEALTAKVTHVVYDGN